MSPADPPSGDWRQPTLEGERLLLRPLRAEDWDALYAVAADPLIWDMHPAWNRWQEPVFRVFFDEAIASGGAVAVIDRASGAIIGTSRWQQSADDPANVEIGWTFLARAWWRTGANRELKRLMLAQAFRHFDTAELRVGKDNLRSRAAIEGIGGKLTDRTETRVLVDKAVEHVIYEIRRESFANGPLSRAGSASA